MLEEPYIYSTLYRVHEDSRTLKGEPFDFCRSQQSYSHSEPVKDTGYKNHVVVEKIRLGRRGFYTDMGSDTDSSKLTGTSCKLIIIVSITVDPYTTVTPPHRTDTRNIIGVS